MHKIHTPLHKLSAKTYHIGERLVLTKTNLNLCKICVSLTTSQEEEEKTKIENRKQK